MNQHESTTIKSSVTHLVNSDSLQILEFFHTRSLISYWLSITNAYAIEYIKAESAVNKSVTKYNREK